MPREIDRTDIITLYNEYKWFFSACAQPQNRFAIEILIDAYA